MMATHSTKHHVAAQIRFCPLNMSQLCAVVLARWQLQICGNVCDAGTQLSLTLPV